MLCKAHGKLGSMIRFDTFWSILGLFYKNMIYACMLIRTYGHETYAFA